MNVNELLDQVEKKSKKSSPKSKSLNDSSFDDVMGAISHNWEDSTKTDEIERLKKEISKLKTTAAQTKDTSRNYTANEKKILSAIRSEVINQNTDSPIISRNVFMRKYKVSSRFLDSSIKDLINLDVIERNEKKYSKNIMTFSYKLKHLRETMPLLK